MFFVSFFLVVSFAGCRVSVKNNDNIDDVLQYEEFSAGEIDQTQAEVVSNNDNFINQT